MAHFFSLSKTLTVRCLKRENGEPRYYANGKRLPIFPYYSMEYNKPIHFAIILEYVWYVVCYNKIGKLNLLCDSVSSIKIICILLTIFAFMP